MEGYRPLKLPTIYDKHPISLTHSYFKYAREALKSGNYNMPEYFNNPTSYNPLLQSEYKNPLSSVNTFNPQMYQFVKNKNPIKSYVLPSIDMNKIKEAEIVTIDDKQYIPLSRLKSNQNIPNDNNDNDNDKDNTREKEYHQLNSLKDLSNKNKRLWKIVRAGIVLVNLLRCIRNYTINSINLKANRIINIQAMKEGLIQIRNFLLPSLGNIENICCDFFRTTLIYNTDNNEKRRQTAFIVKAFVHQIFSDLIAAFANPEDIPTEIKKIFRVYLAEGSQLPNEFLTTFEFNRLEFDENIKLKNLNKERQALLVCFILLYRVLIIDILKNFFDYFPKIRKMKPTDEQIEKKLIYKENVDRRIRDRDRKRERRGINEDGSWIKRTRYQDNEYERDFEDNFDNNTSFGKYPIIGERNPNDIRERSKKGRGRRKRNSKRNGSKRDYEDENDSDNGPNHDRKINVKNSNQMKFHYDKKNQTKGRRINMSSVRYNVDEDNNEGKIPPACPPRKSRRKKGTSYDEDDFGDERKKKSRSKSGRSKSKNRSVSSKKQKRASEPMNSEHKYLSSGKKRNDNKKAQLKKKLSKSKSRGKSSDRRKSKSKHVKDSRSKSKRRKSSMSRDRKKSMSRDRRKSMSRDSYRDREPNKKQIKRSIYYPRTPRMSESMPPNHNNSMLSDEIANPCSYCQYHGNYIGRNSNFQPMQMWEDLDDYNEQPQISERDQNEMARRKVMKLPNKMQLQIMAEEEKKLKIKITHNFYFMINILHHIFKRTFMHYLPKFREDFKERFLYSILVYNKKNKKYNPKNDLIEFMGFAEANEKITNDFCKENFRWLQMYVFDTLQFCIDFSKKVMKI